MRLARTFAGHFLPGYYIERGAEVRALSIAQAAHLTCLSATAGFVVGRTIANRRKGR